TDFLRTGIYLGLKVELPEKEIYSIFQKKDLGKKYYFDKFKKSEGFSYFYDSLEIMVVNSKIYSIGFDLARHPVTLLNNIIIYSETSFELIMKYLDIADINWSFEKQYCYSRELTIKTEGNVLIGCVYDKGNYWLSKFKTLQKVKGDFLLFDCTI
ncbi:hypothetical protein, partial [Gilliamella sp. Gris3-2]|uniref:hypothetical protein n=2 Tax=Gilliamella TaxID=1193503 RepID=UPI001C400686